jgi:hypothetical protein
MALLISLMLLMVTATLSGGLVVATTVEAGIARRYRDSQEAMYAANAAAERAMADLAGVSDPNALVAGGALSTFVDGPPFGTRALGGGSMLDLAAIVNMANCEKPTTCSAAEMDAVTGQRPWGADNPRWQLFAFGPLKDVASGSSLRSTAYVVAMIANDHFQAGVVGLRAEAFAAFGVHRVVELAVACPGPRAVSWRQVQ